MGDACSGTEFTRGDANQDETLDIADPLFVLNALFSPDQPTEPQCWKATDANDDGSVEVSDAVFLLLRLFDAGLLVPPPFDACGFDPTADDLTCESSFCSPS